MRASPKRVSLEKSGVLDHSNVPILEAGSVAACLSVVTNSPGSVWLGHCWKFLKRSVVCVGKRLVSGWS